MIETKKVGVWGWNSWCGLHAAFPLLVGPSLTNTYKRTIDVGFDNLEQSTGLLPHAVLHENGNFASRVEHKCYGGVHGEGYNLDNMICWAKMAMECFLVSGDVAWFKPKFPVIMHTINFILDHFRGKFHPDLIFTGIEGDWTECTDWELDNANVNVNMIRALELLVESLDLLRMQGEKVTPERDYEKIRQELIKAFNMDVNAGGFWHPDRGHFIHGNDGHGEIVHGDKYFESTTNYFSLLWNAASEKHQESIIAYIDTNHEPLEMPFPVLTNLEPRTGTRRKPYGGTVTNGDVWMVLGSHAAAARLQTGNVKIGTKMYRAIIDYERREGVLHNCIYPKYNRVNDSWDPEIGNMGALYAALVLGVLGIKHRAKGLIFNLMGLDGLKRVEMDLFFHERPLKMRIEWKDGQPDSISLHQKGEAGHELVFDKPRFILEREEIV